MRDIKNGLTLRSQLLQKILEESRRYNIQSREWFIKDKQFGVVHERRCDQHTLLHPLGVGRYGRIAPRLQGQELKQLICFCFNDPLTHSTKPAHQLQIFETGKICVDMRLFRYITKNCAKAHKIIMDTSSFEEDPAIIWP